MPVLDPQDPKPGEEVIEEQELDKPEQPEEEQELEESEDEAPEAEEQAVDVPPVSEDRKPSRRESLRIQNLITKMRERGQDTAERPEPPKPKNLDYRTALDADDDVISQLEADRSTYGRNMYDEGLRQAQSMQFHTRLEIDAPRVEEKYPFLDKSSKEFDPDYAHAMNTKYLQFVGYDSESNSVQHPNVRYKDFVEAEIEFAERLAARRVEVSKRNVAQQAATTGLRPDGSSAKRLNLNKDPGQMTDEELDAVISQAIPKR